MNERIEKEKIRKLKKQIKKEDVNLKKLGKMLKGYNCIYTIDAKKESVIIWDPDFFFLGVFSWKTGELPRDEIIKNINEELGEVKEEVISSIKHLRKNTKTEPNIKKHITKKELKEKIILRSYSYFEKILKNLKIKDVLYEEWKSGLTRTRAGNMVFDFIGFAVKKDE